jgi:hypothetical protein
VTTWTQAHSRGACTCGQPYDLDDQIDVDAYGQTVGCRHCQPSSVPVVDVPRREDAA